jgi:putative transposase
VVRLVSDDSSRRDITRPRSRGRPGGLDDLEYATLGYVDWFNHRRLHGEITDDNIYLTPGEFEASDYRQATPADEAATQ